jgi:ferredoxin-thioredoxin reductase catalytic subunit
MKIRSLSRRSARGFAAVGATVPAGSEDNKCICKEFREQMQDPNFEGYCHCMLYYKTKDPIKEEASHVEDHSDQL